MESEYSQVLRHYADLGMSKTEVGKCWGMDPERAAKIVAQHIASELLGSNSYVHDEIWKGLSELAKGFWEYYAGKVDSHIGIADRVYESIMGEKIPPLDLATPKNTLGYINGYNILPDKDNMCSMDDLDWKKALMLRLVEKGIDVKKIVLGARSFEDLTEQFLQKLTESGLIH